MAPDFNSWNPYPFKYRQPEKGIPIGRNQIRSQGLSSSYPKEQDRNGKRRDPGNEVRVAEPLRIVHYREPPPPLAHKLTGFVLDLLSLLLHDNGIFVMYDAANHYFW